MSTATMKLPYVSFYNIFLIVSELALLNFVIIMSKITKPCFHSVVLFCSCYFNPWIKTLLESLIPGRDHLIGISRLVIYNF